MKSLFYMIFPIIFLISCVDKQNETSQERIVKTLEHRNGLKYAIDEKEAFSGKQVSFWDETFLNMKEESSYKDGRKKGLSTAWYKNGQKQYQATYKMGKLDGLTIGWFKNGQKQSEATYINGKREGLITEWYENGERKAEWHYKNGKLVK